MVGVVNTVKGKMLEYGRTLGTTDKNDRVGLWLSKVPDVRFCRGLARSLKIQVTSG